jgi:hypothetical protein
MIDRDARNRLAPLLVQLGMQEIDIDDCWKQAHSIGRHTIDQGVLAVLLFLSSLVQAEADTPLLPLRRRAIPPREELRRLAVSVIFLCSDAEYEWPAFPQLQGGGADCLLCLACAYLCMFAMFAVSGAVMLFRARHHAWGIVVAALAPLFGWGIAKIMRLSFRWRAKIAARWEREIRELGAYDVWPFRRWRDFDETVRSPAVTENVMSLLSSCSPQSCTA